MSKFTIGPFVGSFPHLFTPHAVTPGDEEKFSIQVVMEKENPQWEQMRKLAFEVAKNRWGKVPANLQLTINDGDTTDRAETAGCNYMSISCKADRPPQVVGADRQPIVDPSECYAGAIYYASVRAYAWTYANKKGVSFGLNHVMKAADGDRLDGRGTAEDDFEDIDLSDFIDKKPVSPADVL